MKTNMQYKHDLGARDQAVDHQAKAFSTVNVLDVPNVPDKKGSRTIITLLRTTLVLTATVT